MIYVLETEISNTKNIRESLSEIYGLGKKRSNLICDRLGLSANLKTSHLSQTQVNAIGKEIEKSQLLVTGNLKKLRILLSKSLVSIKSLRGLRRLRGLPVRGQRTHTNAKNSRSRNKF